MVADVAAALRELVRELVREELAAMQPRDDYLTIQVAARLAAVAPGTVRRWVREGRISSYRAGRVLRIRRADLDDLLAVGSRARAPVAQPSPEDLARRDFG